MTKFGAPEIKKLSHLARIKLVEKEVEDYSSSLTEILTFIEQIKPIEIEGIVPLSSPLEETQRLRLDLPTEINQRDLVQKIAPQIEKGFYVVPKVIDYFETEEDV